MARPIPHPGSAPDLRSLHDWAVKLTQGLRERFAPQDTIPEVAPSFDEPPTGMICLYHDANVAVPAGWLECNTVVAQATYPDLFAVCGTDFNVGGEGAGNFRLPHPEGTLGGIGPLIWIIKT